MRFQLKGSLRRRITLVFLIPMTVVYLALMTYVLFSVRTSTLEAYRAALIGQGTALAAVLQPDEIGAADLLARMLEETRLERIWVLDDDGSIYVSSHAGEAGRPLEDRWSRVVSAIPVGGDPLVSVKQADTVFWIVQRLLLETRHRLLLVHYPAPAFRAANEAMLTALLFGFLFWILVLAAVSLSLQWWITRPLERLDVIAAQLVEGKSVSDATLRRVQAETRSFARHLSQLLVAYGQHETARSRDPLDTETLYLAVMESAPAMMLIGRFDGSIVDVNQRLCERIGIPRSWIRSQHTDALRPYLNVELLESLAVRSRKEQCAFRDVEAALHTADTNLVPVRLTVQALQDAGTWYFIAVAVDRSEEEAWKRQLDAYVDSFDLLLDQRVEAWQAANGVLSKLVELAPVLIIGFDAKGALLRWNRRAAVVTGCPSDAPMGWEERIRMLYPDSDGRNRFFDWMASSEAHNTFSSSIRTVAGEHREVLWRCTTTEKETLLIGLDLTRPALLPEHVPDQELPGVARVGEPSARLKS